MKMQTVDLYLDLWPEWQFNHPAFLHATTQPGEKTPGVLRVRITVDLPEHKLTVPDVDASVKGEATLVP